MVKHLGNRIGYFYLWLDWILMNTGWMNGIAADWRIDLEASRDLSEWGKQHFGFVLAWFETWRLKRGLDLCRDAAIRFLREQVKAKARKEWQLERGAEAMRWHEQWLKFCVDQGYKRKSGRLGEEILCDQFFYRQVAKEDKFLDLNIVPRVCLWRSWRLGGLKFFSFKQISLSEDTRDQDAGGFD